MGFDWLTLDGDLFFIRRNYFNVNMSVLGLLRIDIALFLSQHSKFKSILGQPVKN